MTLLRVVQPVVDAIGQGLGVLGREKTVLVQGKLGGGGELPFRDYGHDGLLEGFQGRQSFDLDRGAVDVQVRLRGQFPEAVPVMELEDGIVLHDTVLIQFVRLLFDTGPFPRRGGRCTR